MRTYTSIILLALVSSSLAIFSAQSPTSQTSKVSAELVSIQTEQQGDKAPHRGSGRRQFFQSQTYEANNI
jgi:lipopolysaccharide export system protein LptA